MCIRDSCGSLLLAAWLTAHCLARVRLAWPRWPACRYWSWRPAMLWCRARVWANSQPARRGPLLTNSTCGALHASGSAGGWTSSGFTHAPADGENRQTVLWLWCDNVPLSIQLQARQQREQINVRKIQRNTRNWLSHTDLEWLICTPHCKLCSQLLTLSTPAVPNCCCSKGSSAILV